MKKNITLGLIGTLALLVAHSTWRHFAIREDEANAETSHQDERSGASLSTLTLLPADAKTPRSDAEQLAQLHIAEADDWDTETLSGQIIERLLPVQSALEAEEEIGVLPVADDELVCGHLRPENLKVIFRDNGFVVRRMPDSETAPGTAFRGRSGFSTALESLAESLGTDKKVKVKVVRIKKVTNALAVQIRYEASGKKADTRVQQTAEWHCRWNLPSSTKDELNLARLEVKQFEEIDFDHSGAKLFVDCTESALRHNDCYARQVLPGINHWLRRIPREFLNQFGHHGLAIGDVNGDGLDDLYICDAGGLPNRLYVQQPDGTARDMSASAAVDFLEDSTGALLVDLDNDGDQDLVVATDPVVHIAENDGSGKFTLQNEIQVNTDTFSLSACDFDIDGDLDIYVCGYDVRRRAPSNQGLPFPTPYHDANNGGRNLLLRNEGDLQFTDVTASVGLDVNNSRFSIAAGWEDFDNDGDQDLYVANDFGRNNLYRNESTPEGQRRFRDIAEAAGVQDHASGMSVAWSDYNRDGSMDLYVGNMYSAAGNRVTYQRQFSDGVAPGTVASLRRMARGNSLFANFSDTSKPLFHDVSLKEAVNVGRWAWSSRFADFSNDGWPDIIVANGYLTNEKPDDL